MRPSDRVVKAGQLALDLLLHEKITLICEELGTEEAVAVGRCLVFLDPETEDEYRYSDQFGGDIAVSDQNGRLLFSYSVMHWEYPVRAFRAEPLWLDRLEYLHRAAGGSARIKAQHAYRQEMADEEEAFGN